MKAEHRAAIEVALREITEDDHKLKAANAQLLADLAQRDARIAVLETDLTVAKMQLSAVHQDVTFEADFELEEPADEV